MNLMSYCVYILHNYTSVDELIESRLSSKNGLGILSLNCQSLRA